ncbi:hypothetical protein BGZ60DRAFT_431459 [Tricladium varicosporioides]|nr:hypothetical protein BGZ60DRAFT_431459 [Hymenoscyphus varicosporioides]
MSRLDNREAKYERYLANDLKVPVCRLCHLVVMDPTDEPGGNSPGLSFFWGCMVHQGSVGSQSQNNRPLACNMQSSRPSGSTTRLHPAAGCVSRTTAAHGVQRSSVASHAHKVALQELGGPERRSDAPKRDKLGTFVSVGKELFEDYAANQSPYKTGHCSALASVVICGSVPEGSFVVIYVWLGSGTASWLTPEHAQIQEPEPKLESEPGVLTCLAQPSEGRTEIRGRIPGCIPGRRRCASPGARAMIGKRPKAEELPV